MCSTYVFSGYSYLFRYFEFWQEKERMVLVSNGTRSPADGHFYRNLQNFLAN